MNSNNMMLKPVLQIGQNSSDSSNLNNLSGGNSYHKVAANLFTNQLQSQQQQNQFQYQQQPNYSTTQTSQQRHILQQPESIPPATFLYESIDYKITASHPSVNSSPFNSRINNLQQPSILAQSSVGRNQSPYSGNNSYLFNTNQGPSQQQNTNLLLEKTVSIMQTSLNNQQNMLLSANPSNSNNNYLNNSMNQGSVKCHSATSIQFELRDLQQERLNMKMMSNHSGTEENSPMQLRTADRFNFHRQLSKVSRQNSEDQNKKMHQTINELEGEWNKIKKTHNFDNRSSSPFNNSLNNSTVNIGAKVIGSSNNNNNNSISNNNNNNGSTGIYHFNDQMNRDQWNTQVSENNSVHDQSYENTIKTQGSIKSLTSSCKRVRTQGDSINHASNSSLNKIVHTPSRKQKDQSTSSIKKTQIINKSIPLSKINLDQMRTNSYSSRSQGEQVQQYSVKKDTRQNSSHISNRNSLNNSNSVISTSNTNANINPSYIQQSSIQNKSPISRNSSQDEFSAPKSPDSTFLKIQEKYSNVHKQKPLSKHQDSSNQSINLSQHQQNNSQYLGYTNQLQQQQPQQGQNPNIIYNNNNNNNNSNGNYYNLNQQMVDPAYNQNYQKNSFSDLSVSPHQSQIISQYSQNNIGNGSSTLHQYPSILSQGSTYQSSQTPMQAQQYLPQSSPLPVQRYTSATLTSSTPNGNLLSSQNDLGSNQNNQGGDQSDIYHFNTQTSGASPFNNSNNLNNQLKSPSSQRSSNQINSYVTNQIHHQYTNSINYQNNTEVNSSSNFNAKQPQQNLLKIKDLEQKPQLHSGPSSMQQINLTTALNGNYLFTQNAMTSQTTVNTPSCSQNKNNQMTRYSQQINVGQQQQQQQQQASSSKEKSIIQPVRASPMKKMISDVKPSQQTQQSPKQNGLVKGIQGNSNNNSLCAAYSNSNSSNINYANSSAGNNNNIHQNAYQMSSGNKKDMTQLIMNKIKKMNVARISLNEEDDLFFQSTDTDSFNNMNNNTSKNQMNMKSRVSNNIIDAKNVNQKDYLSSLQSQEIDHIQRTIQLQQQQQFNNHHVQNYEQQYAMNNPQSHNMEHFTTNPLSMNSHNHKDSVSPRAIPQFMPQMSSDANRSSSSSNVLQSQKYFQSNLGADKQPEDVYSDIMMYKQKSNISPVKSNQISSQYQENNTATSSFINQSSSQVKESFLIQQGQAQKPYITSSSNVQQTPINQKKISNNTNYSQKLLDSIQRHAKTHQENQQNIYSTPSNNNVDMKRGIGKVINNTIKKPQGGQGQISQPSSASSSQQHAQTGHSQSQHISMSQQVQLSLQPQLTTAQQQKVYNQALKSYQSASSISQPQSTMQVPHQQMTSQQVPQKTNLTQSPAYNFNLHSPIAKKIY